MAVSVAEALQGSLRGVAGKGHVWVSVGPMESVGSRVRRYRRLAKLTQEELAERAAVDRRYLGKIETDDILEPSVSVVRKLSLALSVPLRSLAEPLGWYEDEPPPNSLADAVAAIMTSDLSEERKAAALTIIRDLFAAD